MKRILVVEDDLSIQDIIYELLKEEGYDVKKASNGKEAYDIFKEHSFDLIITDVMMDVMDGHQLVKLVRSKDSDVKILMLTALGEEYDELKGFDLGVDDYISKPFSFNILLKRIKALLRRGNESDELTIDNIKMYVDEHILTIDDQEVDLTLKEFDILRILMTNQNKVISREALLDEVWGYSYYGDTRVIDTHIKNIRKKTKIDKIKTVTGVGYKLEK
ncbi:response regulator transcription factor [Erysipelotrichaceae bacterium OttesenSCG-928-M19]|nr:response regulator transcription factor [Erysipelotrichaceae bacterium OttesenSCG-928-M19]